MKENSIDKGLSREEWLRLAGADPPPAWTEKQDDLSKRARRGLQYVESQEALQQSLDRLDQRIDRLIKSQPAGKIRRSILHLPSSFRFAAAGLILCLSATVAWISIRGKSGPQLYAAYFMPLDSAIPQTGNVRGTADASSLKAQALSDYENGRYSASVPKFNQYLEEHENDGVMRLYLGIALLSDDRPEQAKDELSQALASADDRFRPAAGWYLALAHLRLNEREPAIGRLQQLTGVPESRFYSRQAKNLLHDLNAGDGSR